MRAIGEVHLDLQAPAPADARGRAEYAAGKSPTPRGVGEDLSDERIVHVKTSGLTFVQKLGVASTDQEIEFQYHGLNGRAKGANFDSDTGVTVLQSEVQVSGLRNGEPVVLTAAHAEMDRGKGELTLERARYLALGNGEATAKGNGRTVRGNGQTLTAEQAVIHLRGEDGSVDHVMASGGVSVEQGGGRLTGRDAAVQVGVENRPERVRVSGDVRYGSDDPLRQVEGRAGEGTARFDGAGRLSEAVMVGEAEFHVRERATAAGAWSDRTVSGDGVELQFAVAGGKKTWLREGVATGGARMLLVDRGGSPTSACSAAPVPRPPQPTRPTRSESPAPA